MGVYGISVRLTWNIPGTCTTAITGAIAFERRTQGPWRGQRVAVNHIEISTCVAQPLRKCEYHADDVDQSKDYFVVLGKPLWEIDVEVCTPVGGVPGCHRG
jgi:hypothetical protein